MQSQAAGERRRAGATPTTPPSLPASDRRRDLHSDIDLPDAEAAERALLDALAAVESGHGNTSPRKAPARDPRGPGLVLVAPVLGFGLWILVVALAFG